MRHCKSFIATSCAPLTQRHMQHIACPACCLVGLGCISVCSEAVMLHKADLCSILTVRILPSRVVGLRTYTINSVQALGAFLCITCTHQICLRLKLLAKVAGGAVSAFKNCELLSTVSHKYKNSITNSDIHPRGPKAVRMMLTIMLNGCPARKHLTVIIHTEQEAQKQHVKRKWS